MTPSQLSSEVDKRTELRAKDNAARSYSQMFLCTGLMVAIAIPAAKTLSVAATIQSTACALHKITNIRQVGDMSQGECVRGRTQWDATATVFVTQWQQTRNATASEQCRPDFDTNWDVGSSYTCEYTSAGVIRLPPNSLLANGELPSSPTLPICAYLAIGWMAAVMTPFLLYAAYRGLLLGCRNRSDDKKKLANPSVAVSRLGVVQVVGSIAFVVVSWIEWFWHFAWAE